MTVHVWIKNTDIRWKAVASIVMDEGFAIRDIKVIGGRR